MRKRSSRSAMGVSCAIGLAMAGWGGSGQAASTTVVSQLTAVATSSSPSPSADAWTKECPGDAFCFSRPPSLVVVPVRAIDSLAGRYRSDTITLTYDLGAYGTSIAHLQDPRQQSVVIDGRPATVFSTAKEIVLVVPKVHETGRRTVRFSMSFVFAQEASPELAMRVFQSIEFKPAR